MGLMSLMFTIAIVGFGSNATQAAYTASDVSAHNTQSDCWMIINGNVYNLTTFVNTHSGGSAVIIGQCGKDGTATFNSGPHRSSTLNAISSLKLGPLTTTPTPTPTPDTPLILTSVVITPTSPVVKINGTLQIVVTPKDQNGAPVNGVVTTYASSNHNAAIINNATGLVKGVALGTTTITTTSIKDGKTITSSIIVTISDTIVPTPIPTPTPTPTPKYDDSNDDDESEYEDYEDDDEDEDFYEQSYKNHENENRDYNKNYEDDDE